MSSFTGESQVNGPGVRAAFYTGVVTSEQPKPQPDFSAVPGAPLSGNPGLLAALAADLEAAGYRHDGVVQAVGESAMDALSREQPVPARRALAVKERDDALNPLSTLIRLFLLGGSVSAQRVEAALPTLGLAQATAIGLLEADPDEPAFLRASIDLRPHASDADAELWVASDVGAHHRPGVLRKDHVLGIGQASLTLAAVTVRRPAARALDLGVGCGIQTFHLLSHCDHVTATDLSERALGFTRFNLLLNHEALGLDPQHLDARVSLLQGSLIDPVAGQRFDLIVSNPPFVITPRRAGEGEEDRFTYRDGGMAGDTLVATLWQQLPEVMAEGATAQMLANWEIPAEQMLDGASGSDPVAGTRVPGWAQRPAEWTAEGMECWVIQRDIETPELYAETWLRDSSEVRSPEAAERSYGAYLDDFASRDVGGIGLGMVWLRRPAPGQPHGVGRVFEEITHAVAQPLGPTIGEAVWRQDAVAAVEPALLHLVAADDVTVETHARPGEEHPQAILLRQGAGLRRVRLLSTAEAGIVSACDGELPLGSLVNAVVALLDATAPGSAPSAQELLESVTGLLQDGFLRFPAPGE